MTILFINAGLKLTNNSDRSYTIEQLNKLVTETVKEKGCQHFQILANKENPNHFTLWERWDNEDYLKSHFEKPHTKAYLAKKLTEIMYIEKLEAM